MDALRHNACDYRRGKALQDLNHDGDYRILTVNPGICKADKYSEDIKEGLKDLKVGPCRPDSQKY